MEISTPESADADRDPQVQHPGVAEPHPVEETRQGAGAHEDPLEEPGYGHGV